MIGNLYHTGPLARRGNQKNLKIGIQWKGGPCVDTVCGCGHQWHRCSTEFMYVLRCPKCDRCYYVGSSVEIVEMNEAEKADLDAWREMTYKPKSASYVPWLSMDEEKQIEEGETAVCGECFESYRNCECPCLQKQVEQLRKENGRLLVQLVEKNNEVPADWKSVLAGESPGYGYCAVCCDQLVLFRNHLKCYQQAMDYPKL